eukprot:3695657-Pyramimonas_sp.AAC.1
MGCLNSKRRHPHPTLATAGLRIEGLRVSSLELSATAGRRCQEECNTPILFKRSFPSFVCVSLSIPRTCRSLALQRKSMLVDDFVLSGTS